MDNNKILADAEWLPHRYDETKDCFRFIHVPRAEHQRVVFLTDEYLTGTEKYTEIPRLEIDRSSVPTAPIHFIFHSAYCCSTLAARMFDSADLAMGLKEPVLLNDLVGWRRRGADPQKLANVLDVSLALLSRPFQEAEAVVVKPSNIINSLAPAIIGLRPNARAFQLYAPIEEFLSSIAVKGMWGRKWAREALVGQARDNILSHQFSAEELVELTDLQVAGLGWLSNHLVFSKMRERFGSDRIAICDSVSLLADPKKTTERFYEHFKIPISKQKIDEIADGGVFNRNSKDQTAYSAEDRRARQELTMEGNREEIEMVAAWVKHLAADIGLNTNPRPTINLY